ncbi:glycosyltransferase family 4 protein [Candidatus Viridilinea mediisalina]|uniref:Glycosyl transferase family 1 n=1 Tax=Candidatus Viridilinea mediisalina TaxID=2024553 RepID=A0A2A6RFM6_9CHLR|nr:glycosyltransferase family 4 protein [Candidatus Viridilinea mediisalina]PDW01688.1 glycosyl transferase family 1 [Candidatus Viridilinea mediisalina]
MRILMLASSFPKWPGETTAPFMEEIAAGVAARGHAVTLLLPYHPELQRATVERAVRLRVYRYAPHRALNVWGYAQSLFSDTQVKFRTLVAAPFALGAATQALMAELEQARRAGHAYDLVHAHWVLPNGPPAALPAALFGLPLVVSLHGSDIYLAERHWALALVAALTLRAADAVTACSGDLRARALALGARPATSHVIPYGVDVGQFRPDPHARAAVRNELGLPAAAPVVLGLGRLVAKKGFGVLLEAWPTVLRTCPDATLVLVGYGDLRASLEAQAAALGISGRVRFTGQLERTRTAAYLAAADVFALPIVRDGVDGLPNTLLEAMGAGRAIVASRVAGVPDVLDDGCHGLIVPERNPERLATALVRLLTDHDLATRLGHAARVRVEQELTWQQTARRYAAVLEAIADSR